MIDATAEHLDALGAARAYAASGLSVIPIRADGTKSPPSRWKEFQGRIANEQEVTRKFGNAPIGVAIVCGAVSGNVEAIDIDDADLYQPFFSEVDRLCTGLMGKLSTVKSPRGYHLYYRCPEIDGNTKLASRAKDDPLFEDKPTLIETRGQGGYILAPGSAAECHETGKPYQHLAGPPLEAMPTISPEQRAVLFRVAKSFDRLIDDSEVIGPPTPKNAKEHEGLAPGDDFNMRASWSEVLEPHGWTLTHSAGDKDYWKRPGKAEHGWSATTGCQSSAGNSLLCVFSSNAHPFQIPVGKQCGAYSRFAAYAILNHGGDYRTAARELGRNGYGTGRVVGNKQQDDSSGPCGLPIITNAVRVGGGEDLEIHAKSMEEVTGAIVKTAGDWPRRVGGTLFVDDPEHGLYQFSKNAELFGWLQRKASVEWYRNVGCVSRDEVFSELQRTVQAYRAIESFPHFPAFHDHYYSHPTVEPGDGNALRELVERFSPATPIDRDLIEALFVSAVWGGAGGNRPAFVIASEAGRGVGKTKLVELVGLLLGGMFAISKDDKAEAIVKRLLTPEAATKRVILFDNVKAARLSWAELESFITAPEISGHQMYRGERTRPNTMLWCITLNGPSMSRDLAQRSVFIFLARPEHDGDWEDSIREFISSNRWKIIADLAGFFLRPKVQFERFTRWGTWEREILARLPEPAEAQKVIAERQAAVNGDDEEAADVEDYFRRELEKLGYDPDVDNVHIPNDRGREWYAKATGCNWSTTAVSRVIKQAADEGMLKLLRINPSRKHGRGLLWFSGTADATFYDIEDRSPQNSWQENRHWDR